MYGFLSFLVGYEFNKIENTLVHPCTLDLSVLVSMYQVLYPRTFIGYDNIIDFLI